MADIAQQIIDAVAAGKPTYVINELAQQREDKIKNEGLAGKVADTSTILKTAYAAAGSAANTSNTYKKSESQVKKIYVEPETAAPESVDQNGIVYTDYNDIPDYSTKATGSTGTSGSAIFGYIVVGLVGIVILDKLIG